MAKQVINVGTLTNDGTGDTLRIGAQKINANFTELYSFLQSSQTGQLSIVSSIVAGEGIQINSPSGAVQISQKAATLNSVGAIRPGPTLSLTAGAQLDYHLPTASDFILGGVKVDGDTITIDNNGVISATVGSLSTLENGNYVATLESTGVLRVPNFIDATNGNGISLDSTAFAQLYWTPDLAIGDPVGGAPTFSWAFVDAGGLTVSTSNTEIETPYTHTWTFDTNGDLTLPAGGQLLANNVSIKGTTSVTIRVQNPLNPLATKDWSFSPTGRLVFPDGTQQTTAYTGGGGGNSFDQNLNTTNDVVFNKVSAGEFASTSAGVPTLTSATNINLSAANAVVVTASPFRLASFTTTQRNALTAVNGDMIYNTTTGKIQGYQSGIWVDLGLATIDGGQANGN